MMKVSHLTYFVRAVDFKSITAAARELHVAQPSLSNAIRALENRLGVKLLERVAQGVKPTPAGKKLYARATVILETIKTMEQDMMALRSIPQGKVSIALPGSMARHLAPKLISNARQQFPNISLEILYGLSSYAWGLLAAKKVDFGVIPETTEIKDLKSIPLYKEQLYAIGVPDFFKRGRKTIRFSDMASLPLVLTTSGNDVRKRLERISGDIDAPLNVIYEQNNLEIIKNLVLEGSACSVLSKYIFDDPVFKGTLTARKIVSPELKRVLVAAWPQGKPLSTAAEAIFALTVETIQQIKSQGIFTGKMLKPQELTSSRVAATLGARDF